MQTVRRGPVSGMREGLQTFCFFECVYQTLFLGLLKPGKFQFVVKDETTVDACCGYDYSGMRVVTRPHCCIVTMHYHILREASALSVLQ